MSSWSSFGFAEPAPLFTPPPARDAQDQLARLRLIRSRRVGPATYLRLMAEHGDATAALAALPEVAHTAGVKDYSPCPEGVAAAELQAASRIGAHPIFLGDAHYPTRLAQIADAPPIIWVLGQMHLLNRPSVAVVGTRNTSSLGARMARHLATDLGEAGFVIVSGLARGVDALAHHAALATGTIAVQAGGLDVLYPAENTDLAHAIGKSGLRLSEQPFGLNPQARHFPRRNRLVSGLVHAVIVVEAAARSGSLITARAALDQGREVLAVPGHPMDSRASGCNILIRDGAVLVRNAEDVIAALGGPTPVESPPPSAQKTPASTAPKQDRITTSAPKGGLEGAILMQLGEQPVAEDQLIRDLGGNARDVAQTLAVLEMAGRIERAAGGMVRRV